MQWLNGEADARAFGLWKQRGNAVADLVEILLRRLAERRTANEYDHRQAERLGFAQGTPVRLNGRVASGSVLAGEEAAADETDWGQTAVIEMLLHLRQIMTGDG